jgi:hypothetical protein
MFEWKTIVMFLVTYLTASSVLYLKYETSKTESEHWWNCTEKKIHKYA